LPDPWQPIDRRELSAIDKFTTRYKTDAAIRARFKGVVEGILQSAQERGNIIEAVRQLSSVVWIGANGSDVVSDNDENAITPHHPNPPRPDPPAWSGSIVQQYQIAFLALANIQMLAATQAGPD